MPRANAAAVAAMLTTHADILRHVEHCDDCGAPLRLHVHSCEYCLPTAPARRSSPSTTRARIAAQIERQEATRSPWVDVPTAFFASDAFKAMRAAAGMTPVDESEGV